MNKEELKKEVAPFANLMGKVNAIEMMLGDMKVDILKLLFERFGEQSTVLATILEDISRKMKNEQK